jgi:hypothetical protein
MNERLNELRLDAGIAQLKDDPRLVVIDREGNVIDPLIGLEKFAELIVGQCAAIANQQFEIATGLTDRDCLTAAEMKKHFGVEE